MKRFFKVILVLAFLAALTYGGYVLHQRQASETTAATPMAYTPIGLTMGSLSQEVISTGSLTIAQTTTAKAPAALTLDNVQVRTGQAVAAGDVLATVDTASLDSAIYALQTELETVDDSLVSLAASYDSQQTLYTPIKGRVKQLYGHKGDRVQDVVAAYGCLYVLSLDGKLCVQIPASEETVLGERLTVVNAAENTYSGAVVAVDETTATLTFSDLAANEGDTVTVLLSGEKTASGVCSIHMPLKVSSTAHGVITTELLRMNKYCDKKDSAYVISYLEPTQEYMDLLAQREELMEQISTLQALKTDPALRAEVDGIISEVTVVDGQAVAAGDALATLYVGQPDTMTISVDELDIIHVKEGQTATVVMDALPSQTYPATVTYLSTLGTASSGITSYDVTVKLDGDEQLKLGMNGTVTIAVGQQENVLLVPLVALQSDSQGSYVWRYSPEYVSTEEAPGIKTYVNTGLSNEEYAAVTGGLQAGDQVLVVRSVVTTDAAQEQGGGMPGGDWQPPGENILQPGNMGERNNGTQQRPDGMGGGRTNTGEGSGAGGNRTAPGGAGGN